MSGNKCDDEGDDDGFGGWPLSVLREKLVALRVNAHLFYSDKDSIKKMQDSKHTQRTTCKPHVGRDQTVELTEGNMSRLF